MGRALPHAAGAPQQSYAQRPEISTRGARGGKRETSRRRERRTPQTRALTIARGASCSGTGFGMRSKAAIICRSSSSLAYRAGDASYTHTDAHTSMYTPMWHVYALHIDLFLQVCSERVSLCLCVCVCVCGCLCVCVCACA